MIRTIAAICSSTSSQGPQEGIDHLFLLPERVLGMDGAQLRKDLAALDFKVQLLQSAPSGNVWLCKYRVDSFSPPFFHRLCGLASRRMLRVCAIHVVCGVLVRVYYG